MSGHWFSTKRIEVSQLLDGLKSNDLYLEKGHFTQMKKLISILSASIVLSCHKAEVKINDTCTLSNNRQIENLRKDGIASGDSARVNFENVDYSLMGYSISVTEKFYDYRLNRKTVDFGDLKNDVHCKITIFFPGDSSYFNNKDYLTKHKIRDGDTPEDRSMDSLVFVKQCPFGLYIKLKSNNGEEYKSTDKDDLSTDFYQIDSIQYIPRVNLDYSQFKVYSHFNTRVVSKTKDEKILKGELVIQFETKKK